MTRDVNPDCLKIMADRNTFGPGTAAFLDTFAGMVPCKVRKVLHASYGFRCSIKDEVEIELTETRGAYKQGEVLTAHASDVPPRKMIRYYKYSSTVITTYKYVPKP